MDLKKIDVKKVIIFSALGVGTVIGATIAVKQVIKLIKRDEGKKYLNDSKDDIVKSDKTYTDAAYQAMSDSLYTAMKGGGTDYPTVEHILKQLKTKTDYILLAQAFDVRKVDNWVYSFSGNLNQWLVDEIDADEREELLGHLGVHI